MTTEQLLRDMLHDLTPEPPREIDLDGVAVRVLTPTPAPRSGRRDRWLPSLAAAAVVALVAGGVLLFRGGTATHPAAPAGSSPRASATPAPTHSAAPVPGPALSGTVYLGGARVALPSGWVARSLPGQSYPVWCVSPKSAVPTASAADCTITFTAIPGVPGNGFSSESGGSYDPGQQFCSAGATPTYNKVFGFRDLGGRTADFRHWTFNCPDGTTVAISQYTVATGPAYILYSRHATAAVDAVLAGIATKSVLPAQRTTLRYEILGSIESRLHRSDGYAVVLRPWTRQADGQFVAVPGGVRQTYVIPNSLVPADVLPALTGLIQLTTDGTHVTALSIVGG